MKNSNYNSERLMIEAVEDIYNLFDWSLPSICTILLPMHCKMVTSIVMLLLFVKLLSNYFD